MSEVKRGPGTIRRCEPHLLVSSPPRSPFIPRALPYVQVNGVSEVVKIRVSADTRADLKALGRKGESYDAVIQRLIKEFQALEETRRYVREHLQEPSGKEAEG